MVMQYYDFMADSTIAIAATLIHEGGYVNNLADPGGATNMGITQADMPGQDMRVLTVAQATQYYLQHYWKSLYSQITSQLVANKLFDMGVLFGVGTAVKIMQAIFERHGIVADGQFGPRTLDIVNTAEPTGLLAEYKKQMVAHTTVVVARNPTLSIFSVGWINRINS